jgi:hypothetical protein
LGDSALAVDIIVALIKTLGLTELVSDALASRKQKEAETNAKIVDLFKEALDEIKNCRTEQQRVEFHIALACVMPPREAQGSKTGWIKPICDRLGLKRGKRSEKNGARPYASEQAVETRAIFNKDRELLAQPIKVGDMVLSKGQLCELTAIGHVSARSRNQPTTSTPCRFSMQGHHVMFFFYVSWCTEALCEEVVQLLVHGMLACAWPRTRIPVLWTESHGGRLYAHQADLLDRRRIYCHSISRDSES